MEVNVMRSSRICLSLFSLLAAMLPVVAPAAPPDRDTRNAQCLKPAAANPFYWEYKGAPVVLLGGSVEDNLFQIPDLEPHLDLLKASGGNYIRNTLSSRDEGNVWMFHQNEDGKYDLERLNDEYYRRLELILELCLARDIVVQYELWDRFDYAMKYWEKNPFRPANNINYTEEASGLLNDYPDHPGSNKNRFFRSEPAEENNALILKYQQMHIDRVLALSLPYPNVLYCMDNETGANPEWGAYWSGYVKAKATEMGVVVQTTEMWDDWNLQGKQHRSTLDHPEIYSFVDMSQNNHNDGEKHWGNLLWVRDYLKDAPRPINHVKCYGADGGRFGGSQQGEARFWRSLLGGAASIRFHRPDSGLGLNERAQANLKSARMFVEAFDFVGAEPKPYGAELNGQEETKVYLTLNHRNGQQAWYFPEGGEVTSMIANCAGGTVLRWLDIEKSQWLDPVPAGGLTQELKAPDARPWIVIKESEGFHKVVKSD
jgi:hypothetical protein